MIIEKENEIIRHEFRYDDYIFKCYDYASTKIKWEAPAYRMSRNVYTKENGEFGGRLKAMNAIIVFKNDNVYEDLDKDYVYTVLNAEFATHEFKGEIDTFYGRVLNNGSIEWGIHVDGENPPF